AVAIAALEAMACGAAVVLTKIRGFEALVSDGVNGRLVPVRDVEALSRAIPDAWNHREAWGEAACKTVQERYNMRVLYAQLAQSLPPTTRKGARMTGHPDQEFFLMKPRKTLARSNMPAGPENTGWKCGEIRRRPIHGPTAPHGLVSGRSRLLGLAIFAVGLLPLANVLPAVAGGGDGFDSLFNGNSLDGWRGKAQFWSVRDGSINGETTAENPTDGNTFLIFRDRVADFELVLKVRILQGNSGIQYRSVD
ncbi:hypothetical protein KXV85_000613, partial [Aspergillus fumigatus]